MRQNSLAAVARPPEAATPPRRDLPEPSAASSITSSARMINDPSAFQSQGYLLPSLMLMDKVNLEGSSTGRSRGEAPCRTRCANAAARW